MSGWGVTHFEFASAVGAVYDRARFLLEKKARGHRPRLQQTQIASFAIPGWTSLGELMYQCARKFVPSNEETFQ